MEERIKEAVNLLREELKSCDCLSCRGKYCVACNNYDEQMFEYCALNLINKIKDILIPRAHWVRYTDDDEYYCSNCEWPAPRDAHGKFRYQPAYCPICGTRMIDEEGDE